MAYDCPRMLYHCNQLSGQNGVRYCGSNDYGDNRNNQRTIFMDCQCIPVGLYIRATGNGLLYWYRGSEVKFCDMCRNLGLATMGHALTGTWSGLAFMRALMGFSEASAIPAGVKPHQHGSRQKSVAWRQVFSIWAPHSARCLLHRWLHGALCFIAGNLRLLFQVALLCSRLYFGSLL